MIANDFIARITLASQAGAGLGIALLSNRTTDVGLSICAAKLHDAGTRAKQMPVSWDMAVPEPFTNARSCTWAAIQAL